MSCISATWSWVIVVSVPESPPQVLYKTTLVQLIALTYIKCYALAMFNWTEVVLKIYIFGCSLRKCRVAHILSLLCFSKPWQASYWRRMIAEVELQMRRLVVTMVDGSNSFCRNAHVADAL